MQTSKVGEFMLKKEILSKLEGRMTVLSEILDSEIQALCEAKANIEIIAYLFYWFQKEKTINNEFGLPERTMNELLDYFKSKPEIEKVVIYGSRAKGTYRNGSDIDFAIWSDNESISGIAIDLDDLPTPYKFDVINYKTLIHQGMKNSIDNEGKIFYQRS